MIRKLLVMLYVFVALLQPAAARGIFEIGYGEIEEAVSLALQEKGIGYKVAVTVLGVGTGAAHAFDRPVAIQVKGLRIEKQDHRWSANLLFVADGEVVSAAPSGGRFEEIVELPMLKQQALSGDVITAGNIEIRDFPLARVRPDTVTDMTALIGKSPRHSISPFRPVRAHEIASPAVIKKNALVQMHYRSPGMEITATGQAMSDGAAGDTIDIRNMNSKKMIRAVVTGGNTVAVMAQEGEAYAAK